MPKATPILIVRVPELPSKRIGVYADPAGIKCPQYLFDTKEGCDTWRPSVFLGCSSRRVYYKEMP